MWTTVSSRNLESSISAILTALPALTQCRSAPIVAARGESMRPTVSARLLFCADRCTVQVILSIYRDCWGEGGVYIMKGGVVRPPRIHLFLGKQRWTVRLPDPHPLPLPSLQLLMRAFDLITVLATAVVAVAVPIAPSQASCGWQCPKTDAMYNALLSSAPGPYHDIGCTYTYSTDDGILVKDWTGGNRPYYADKPCASQSLNVARDTAKLGALRLMQTMPAARSNRADVEDENTPIDARTAPPPRTS